MNRTALILVALSLSMSAYANQKCDAIRAQALRDRDLCSKGNPKACVDLHRIGPLVSKCGTEEALEAIKQQEADEQAAYQKRLSRHANSQADLDRRRHLQLDAAAHLPPAIRVALISGIICEAEDQVRDAKQEIAKERSIGKASGSVDLEVLHEQGIIVVEQTDRARRARVELGKASPMSCKSSDVQRAAYCIAAKVGLGHKDDDCQIRDFWKYEIAVQQLDPVDSQ